MNRSPRSKSGEVLAQQMQERQVTQKDLAEQLDVSQAYISALTSGKKSLSPNTADKIASVLALNAQETTLLHRAAAVDQGFKLDLPDDF